MKLEAKVDTGKMAEPSYPTAIRIGDTLARHLAKGHLTEHLVEFYPKSRWYIPAQGSCSLMRGK